MAHDHERLLLRSTSPTTSSNSPPLVGMTQTAQNVAEVYGLTREELDEFAAREPPQVRARPTRPASTRTRSSRSRSRTRSTTTQGNWVESETGKTVTLRPRRVHPPRHHGREARGAPADQGRDQLRRQGDRHHRGQLLPDERRRHRGAAHERGEGARGSASAARAHRRHRRRRREAAAHGHRPDRLDEEGAEHAGLRAEQIDRVEFNEAFAAQVLPSIRELGIPLDRVNVNGGSIAHRPPARRHRRAARHHRRARAPPQRRALRPRHAVHRRRHGHLDDRRAHRLGPATESRTNARRPAVGPARVPGDGPGRIPGKWGPPGAAVRPRERLSPLSSSTRRFGVRIPVANADAASGLHIRCARARRTPRGLRDGSRWRRAGRAPGPMCWNPQVALRRAFGRMASDGKSAAGTPRRPALDGRHQGGGCLGSRGAPRALRAGGPLALPSDPRRPARRRGGDARRLRAALGARRPLRPGPREPARVPDDRGAQPGHRPGAGAGPPPLRALRCGRGPSRGARCERPGERRARSRC